MFYLQVRATQLLITHCCGAAKGQPARIQEQNLIGESPETLIGNLPKHGLMLTIWLDTFNLSLGCFRNTLAKFGKAATFGFH
jgi:hypothetical protein